MCPYLVGMEKLFQARCSINITWLCVHGFNMSVYVCVCAAGGRLNGHSRPERRPEIAGYETSSTLMSSELDTTSFFDSEEDDSTSRWETQPFVNNLMTQLLWYQGWTSQENTVYSTFHCRADEQTTQICDLDRFHEYIWSSEANKQETVAHESTSR